MRTPIRGAGASWNPPGVALQTIVDIKPSLGQDFSFVNAGPPNDQLNSPPVRGRCSDVIEALLEQAQLGVLQHTGILHGPTRARPAIGPSPIWSQRRRRARRLSRSQSRPVRS